MLRYFMLSTVLIFSLCVILISKFLGLGNSADASRSQLMIHIVYSLIPGLVISGVFFALILKKSILPWRMIQICVLAWIMLDIQHILLIFITLRESMSGASLHLSIIPYLFMLPGLLLETGWFILSFKYLKTTYPQALSHE